MLTEDDGLAERRLSPEEALPRPPAHMTRVIRDVSFRGINIPGFHIFYLYIFILAVGNTCVWLVCASRATPVRGPEWAPTYSPAAFFAFCYVFQAALSALPALVVLRDVFWRRAAEERSQFFALWSAMMVPLNGRSYVDALMGSNDHPDRLQYKFAWPTADWCWNFAYMWAAACILQHLYVPAARPSGRKGCVGVLAFLLTFLVTIWFICWNTGHSGAQPCVKGEMINDNGNKNLGFLADNADKYLPFFSLMLTELLRFLRTGDGDGVAILGKLLMVNALCNSQDWAATLSANPEQDGSGLLLAFSLLVGVAACAATYAGRPLSSDIAFQRPEAPDGHSREVITWQPDASWIWVRRLLVDAAKLMDFTFTFRGMTWMCMANSFYSFAFYASSRDRIELDFVPMQDGGTIYTGRPFIDAVILYSGISFAVSAVSLLGDESDALRWLPVDRHFRFTILLKASMLANKIVVLFFNQKPSNDVTSLVLQLVAILGTILMTTGSDLKRIYTVPDGKLLGWRNGRALRWSYILCVLCFQILAAEVAIGTAWGSSGNFVQVLNKARAGIAIHIPMPYVYGFLAFFNEIRLFLYSLEEERGPHDFYKVESKQGVRTLAAVCAVHFPLAALNNWIFTDILYWGYIKDLATGIGEWGPKGSYLGGWTPPVTCYASMCLGIGACFAWWASEPALVAHSTNAHSLARAISHHP